ncbi:DUF6049 family protein [Streptacidiphilus cavernicola]|uniref:DUF6049 family protein n=1 Tax=Streptacidiphilus cavernicola TaxID=3342716 RepID=A0ABV6VUY8_9ACTN
MAARHTGRSTRLGGSRFGGGRRWERTRRAGTVLLAAGLALGSGTALAPAAGAAQYRIEPGAVTPAQDRAAAAPAAAVGTVRASGERYPAKVVLSAITPAVPSPTGTITLKGTVTNTGTSTISTLHVGVWVDPQPLASRSDIASVADQDTPQSGDPQEVDRYDKDLGDLAPGATSPVFSLTVDIASLQLGADHVYQLAVDAQGAVSSAAYPHPLGIARTYLPLFSSKEDKPTRIATLWPLVEAPRVQPQTYADAAGNEEAVFSDDTLAADLGAEGRLGQLESIGADLGLSGMKPTWVIDPDLIAGVLKMTPKYRVVSGDDSQGVSAGCDCTKPGTGTATATGWRNALQTALNGLDGQQVISLPAADPDLASIAHNAPGSSTLKDAVQVAGTDLGQVGLNPLQVEASHNVAWPYQGYLDSSVVALARDAGDTRIVANGASLPSPGLNYTPDAARSLGGGTTAVAADPTLSAIFAGDLSTPSAQTMAEQRFLAETLAITLEQPNNQRSILIQPPRNMSASTAQVLAASLKAAVAGAWATPAAFGSVAAAKPSPGAGKAVPSPSSYPASARKSELNAGELYAVSNTEDKLAELEKILVNPATVRTAFSSAILRSVSTQWRAQPGLGDNYRDNAADYLMSLYSKVSILPKPGGTITLSGSGSATIPITVQNDLSQGVINLEVELSSTNAARLSLGSQQFTSVASRPVAAGGGTKITIKFPVKAFANNKVQMVAQLYTTADHKPYGDPVGFTVDITKLPGGVIAVMAGGGLLVLLAGLRLYWKRKHTAGGPDGDTDDGADDTGDGEGDDPAEGPEDGGTAPTTARDGQLAGHPQKNAP